MIEKQNNELFTVNYRSDIQGKIILSQGDPSNTVYQEIMIANRMLENHKFSPSQLNVLIESLNSFAKIFDKTDTNPQRVELEIKDFANFIKLAQKNLTHTDIIQAGKVDPSRFVSPGGESYHCSLQNKITHHTGIFCGYLFEGREAENGRWPLRLSDGNSNNITYFILENQSNYNSWIPTSYRATIHIETCINKHENQLCPYTFPEQIIPPGASIKFNLYGPSNRWNEGLPLTWLASPAGAAPIAKKL